MTHRQALLIVAAVATFLTFWNLHLEPLREWDEAWHAKIALDMERSGRWLAYTFDGEVDSGAMKPPLCFWTMGLLFKLLGPTALAVRLFSAVCFVILVVVVAHFGSRRFNPAVGLMAAVLLATDKMLLFNHCARAGDMDAPLMLFLGLTMLGLWRMRLGGSAWRVGVPLAAASLTKGLAVMQVVPVAIGWLLVNRNWRLVARCLLVMALALVPFAVWLAVRESRQPGVARILFESELTGRLTGDFLGRRDPVLSYVWSLGRSAYPVLIAVIVLVAVTRGRLRLVEQLAAPGDARPMLCLLLIWWLVPFVLFSAVGTHHNNYVYPSYVPAYLLAAWLVIAGARTLETMERGALGSLVVALMLMAVGAQSVWKAVHRSRSDQRSVAEYVQLSKALNEVTKADELALYRPWPVARFVLTSATIPYRVLKHNHQLSEAFSGHAPPRFLLCRGVECQEALQAAGNSSTAQTLVMPQTGYVLTTFPVRVRGVVPRVDEPCHSPHGRRCCHCSARE